MPLALQHLLSVTGPTAAVFDDANGHRGFEVSGRDEPWSEFVEDWIDEYGWLPSRDRVETHVEAKSLPPFRGRPGKAGKASSAVAFYATR